MNLSVNSISINSSTKISLHPLAEQLTKLIARAYLIGRQEPYLKSMNAKFSCHNSLPIHNVSLISKKSNEYLLIGGCFSPVFDLKDLNNDNTIFLTYKTSKKKFKPEYKNQVEEEFSQDVIDCIYMDFIRVISILSLAKPGLMYQSLKTITQEYDSQIWGEIFNSEAKNPKNYILLNNVADLLDMTRGALNNQAKLKK